MSKKYLPLTLLFAAVFLLIAAPRVVKSDEKSISNELLTPYLVKDINQQGLSSNPHELTNVNGTLFFIVEAWDGTDSLELWKSDGTESGTEMVKLFYSDYWNFRIDQLTAVNDRLFFQVNDPAGGNEYQLWVSDGTEAGTTPIKTSNDAIVNTVGLNGVFYFIQKYYNSSSEYGTLWRSDGTPAGTYALTNTSVYEGELKQSNNSIYFFSSGLWRSDGTIGGTNQVKEIEGFKRNLTDVNGTLFFTSDANLYKSDGTNAGTTLVKEIPSYYEIKWLTNINGMLFFSAYDDIHGIELWHSDGTESGTGIVKDINPGIGSSHPAHLIDINGTAFFYAGSGSGSLELWKSDGTEAGTTFVQTSFHNLTPGSDTINYYEQTNVNLNGLLVFRGIDEAHNDELWVSDGTTSGTTIIKDIYPGGYGSNPTEFVLMNGVVYFAATSWEGGLELWRSDGTNSGTYQVMDIDDRNDGGVFEEFAVLSDEIIFGANDGIHGLELWKSDGTTSGTTLIKNIYADAPDYTWSSKPLYLETFGSQVVFRGSSSGYSSELFISDGTADGTQLVKDINPSGYGSPRAFRILNDKFLFVADCPSYGDCLWVSDGTEEGTSLLRDKWPTYPNEPIHLYTIIDGNLYFTVEDNELWKSDGTKAGTVLIKEFELYSTIAEITAYNGEIFFRADGGNGNRLWKSNGTPDGTKMVAETNPDDSPGYPSNLFVHKDTLFFSAQNAFDNMELWKSDGTEAGTVLVADINPSGGSSISTFASFDGMLYFGADDGTNGKELWKSDGTEAGTVLVADIATGSSSSTPNGFTEYNNQLYFYADDGIDGYQVWVTDGTETGTILLTSFHDVRIYPYHNYFWIEEGFFNALGKLFFIADDGTTGMELWAFDALNPSGPPASEAVYLPMILNP